VGDKRHAQAASPPAKRSRTHRTGGWVGTLARVDVCGKSRPQQDSIRGISVVEELNMSTEYWWNDTDGKKPKYGQDH